MMNRTPPDSCSTRPASSVPMGVRVTVATMMPAAAVATPMPYRRTGPGLALDGQPKFDLDKWDPAYFERVRARVEARAAAR